MALADADDAIAARVSSQNTPSPPRQRPRPRRAPDEAVVVMDGTGATLERDAG